jgi:peptidoglycan/xylan/chitin deacetylase (PgdA/CDA1 family)
MRYRFLRFPQGKGKALTFSYDDGCSQDPKFAELLTRYGLKGTFNLNSDEQRGSSALPKEVIEESFINQGHEIAVHGYFHRAEGGMRPIEGIQDVLNCRLELEKKYGRIIRGMAYPDFGIRRFHNGASYEKVKAYLTELDIAYCRTLGGDNNRFDLPTDWYAWMPTAHHDNKLVFDYIEDFLKIDFSTDQYVANRHPRLFYLWGHSYEFDRNNNWDRIEKICELLSGRDDIWYATNIEIHDYIEAYHSLVYSADGTMIYNPTLMTIWFDIDGVGYSIAPGETLRI